MGNEARVRPTPVIRLIPNAITLTGLGVGLTSLYYAHNENWEGVVLCMFIAGVIDCFDGAVARWLNVPSDFGRELDSLSDLCTCGVAPSFAVYLWCVHELGAQAWLVTLGFAACCATRLALFNIRSQQQAKSGVKDPRASFFRGVPAPMAAGLILLPMTLSFVSDWSWLSSPRVNFWNMGVVAAMMVVRFPTMSFKQIPMKSRPWRIALGVFVAAIVVGSICNLWYTLIALALIYLVTLPLGPILYQRAGK